MLNRLSIRERLLAAFCFLLLALAGLGAFSVARMQVLYGATAPGQAADQVGASSGALTQRALLLRQQVGRFLAGIRAA